MNRNIALIRYRKFEDDLLLLEQLTSATTKLASTSEPTAAASKGKYKTVSDNLAAAAPEVQDRYHLLANYLLALGDDIESRTLEYYVAFRRIKNFACVEVRNQANRILVYLKVNPDTVTLEKGFTRDVRGIGHYGTGDLEVSILSDADFEKAKPLLDRSYDEA